MPIIGPGRRRPPRRTHTLPPEMCDLASSPRKPQPCENVLNAGSGSKTIKTWSTPTFTLYGP